MSQEANYREQLIEQYRVQIEPLLRFLPWLESKTGSIVSSNYKENGIENGSLSFPVYDSMLMQFIQQVEELDILDRNYVYLYSRYQIKTPQDELKCIAATDLATATKLHGILSRYIMKGRTKSELWAQGVEEGIYLAILQRWKKILDIWDGPLV